MMERVSLHRLEVPWGPEQVAALNRFQECGHVHPFTCTWHSEVPLVATRGGWVCPVDGCDYKQDWAWKEMLVDPSGDVLGHA